MGIQYAKVQRHADGNKEQPEQQPLERIDSDLQFVAILTFRQQHAGNKGAQRHRQPQRLHKQGRSEDQQQRGGSEHLPDPRAGDKTEHRPQQIASANQHPGKGQDLHADRQPVHMLIR